MHAKELENDIDPDALTSAIVTEVDETACRGYLVALREAIAHVFAQLPNVPPPIVTATNVKWMNELEVP